MDDIEQLIIQGIMKHLEKLDREAQAELAFSILRRLIGAAPMAQAMETILEASGAPAAPPAAHPPPPPPDPNKRMIFNEQGEMIGLRPE